MIAFLALFFIACGLAVIIAPFMSDDEACKPEEQSPENRDCFSCRHLARRSNESPCEACTPNTDYDFSNWEAAE